MPAESPPACARPGHVRHTQGVALIVTLLAAMILMVFLLAVSSTMVVSSQRTTADQEVTLQAQYAAEAGLACAQLRFTEAQALFPLIESERTVSLRTLKAAVDDYCGGGRHCGLRPSPRARKPSPTAPATSRPGRAGTFRSSPTTSPTSTGRARTSPI